MFKGLIVLVPFPFTDMSGHKVRPAVVLYNSLRGEDCIVAFVSSVIPKKLYAFDIAVKKSARNGLKSDSVIKLDKLATLQKKVVIGELGVLEPVLIKLLDKKLQTLFKI